MASGTPAALYKGYEGTTASDSLGGTALGKVTETTLKIDQGTEAFYTIGSRTPDAIKEGNMLVTGSVEQAFRDKTELIDTVSPGGGDGTLQSDDDLYIQIADAAGSHTTVDLTLADLKWVDWETSIKNDGSTIMEKGNFIVKTLTIAETAA